VTDANMALGFLNPVALAGGSLQVDPEQSRRAIDTHIGEPLGLDTLAAAHGIRHVANVSMARALRAVTVERGRDPRDMTMIAFGGGGPLHAVDVARLLGIRRVIAPVMAGVFCSAGMLGADAEHNFVKAVLRPLADCDATIIGTAIEALRVQGLSVLAQEGYPADAVEIAVGLDLRYLGQSSELTIPLRVGAGQTIDATAMAALIEDFASQYRQTFGYSNDEPLELVNVRLSAYGRSDQRLKFNDIRVDASALQGVTGTRQVSFERDQPPCETQLVPRAAITEVPRHGPLIIESYDTTIVVPPGASARADKIGNIIIDIAQEQA
jgi:N-methylhydantoinase A